MLLVYYYIAIELDLLVSEKIQWLAIFYIILDMDEPNYA